MAAKTLKVRQIKSSHGILANHKACLTGLGLRRIRHEVELIDTPAVRGMINKVRHLVQVVGE
jgi:large subunit ribosomal protein L30